MPIEGTSRHGLEKLAFLLGDSMAVSDKIILRKWLWNVSDQHVFLPNMEGGYPHYVFNGFP